jgi:protein-tyrosine phosphatase
MNFRDFGGYAAAGGRRVKPGRLFRSGALGGLTDRDHAVLQALRIRLICDLRRDSEKAHVPTRWCPAPVAELWHLPLFKDDESASLASWAQIRDADGVRMKMIDTYRALVTTPSILAKFRTFFERLAHAESCPVLIHCSAGKDRTGVLCALILSALGVDRAVVMEDFLLTTRYYDSERAWTHLSSQILDLDMAKGWSKETLAPVFGLEPAYLQTAFDAVDASHGSVQSFLTGAIGLTPARLDEIRAHLLD